MKSLHGSEQARSDVVADSFGRQFWKYRRRQVLVTEKESGPGTTITYLRPSSLIVIEENSPLREASKALDEKLDALIAKATDA